MATVENARRFCGQCGQARLPDDKFCRACGSALPSGVPSGPAVPPHPTDAATSPTPTVEAVAAEAPSATGQKRAGVWLGVAVLAVAVAVIGAALVLRPWSAPSGVAQVPSPSSTTTPYDDFLAWESVTKEAIVGDLDNIQEATNSGDADKVHAAGMPLRAKLAAGVAWLDAHPPDPCYADVHRHFRRQLELWDESLAVSLPLAERALRVGLTEAEGEAGFAATTQFDEGTAEGNAATAAKTQAEARCAASPGPGGTLATAPEAAATFAASQVPAASLMRLPTPTLTPYMDFAAWGNATMSEILGGMSSFMAAATSGDAAAGLKYGRQFKATLDTALAWLMQHRPDPCYADLYTKYLSAVQTMMAAMATYLPALEQGQGQGGSTSTTDPALESADEMMNRAATDLGIAGAMQVICLQ